MNDKVIPNFNKKIKPTKKQLLILYNIRKCKKVTDYINFRLNKDTTKRAYASYIRDFFIHLEISNIDNYFKDPRRMNNGKRLDYTDKIEQNIQSFNKSLKKVSGSNRLSNLSAIRKLLEYNRIDLGNSFWEGIRKAGTNADRETEIITPTREQLRNILNRANNESKAFFLMQMTSGSRIEEIRTLTFDNLHLDTDPPSFRVTKDHSKTGRAITKFFSDEAKYYLKEYLDKDRDKILITRTNRARRDKVKLEYKNMVFPMGKTNPELMWNNLCKKEGLYKLELSTNYPIMGTHSLRRFFEDNIGHGKLSKYMLNKLSKSEEPYSFKTKHKLENLYKDHMDNLYIFDTPKKTKEDIYKLQEDLSIKDKEINRLKEGMEFIYEGRKSFEEKTRDFENRFINIEENLNNLFEKKGSDFKEQFTYFSSFLKSLGAPDEMIQLMETNFPNWYDLIKDMPLEEVMNIKDINEFLKKTKYKGKRIKENGEPHSTAQKD